MSSIEVAAAALRAELLQIDQDWFCDQSTPDQQKHGLKILAAILDANLSELCGFGQRPRCVAALFSVFNDDQNTSAIRDNVIVAVTLIYESVPNWAKADKFVAAAATDAGFRGNNKANHKTSFTPRAVKLWRDEHRAGKYGPAPRIALENARAQLYADVGGPPSPAQTKAFVKEYLRATFCQLRASRIEKDS